MSMLLPEMVGANQMQLSIGLFHDQNLLFILFRARTFCLSVILRTGIFFVNFVNFPLVSISFKAEQIYYFLKLRICIAIAVNMTARMSEYFG